MSDGDQQLDDEVLHEICGISATDEGYSAELAADLRRVVTLTQTSQSRHNGQLEHAIALLTSALGRLPKHHLTHLPFGYDGPRVQSCGWVDREGIETAAKQIAGLLWSDASPGMVAVSVANGTTESVRLSLINQQEYDAWHPGMASGSGWRRAVKATPYGLTKGRLLCGDGQNSSKPATSPVAVTQPPKQQSSLSIISALCDDANYCLQLLGNLCRAYELMSATGRRMSGGGEEWHFDNPSDGDQYQDAEHRVESVKQQLPEPLARLIDWGRSQSLDLPDSDFPFSLCATSGVKEDIAAEYELAVRRVLTALMTASSRPGTTGGTPQSPIENTRLRAIESLLQPLIRVDVGILNLGVHLQRLRTENPHGFVNALSDGKLTSAQVRDVQERIESWTDPLQKKIEKAKEACDNIASQLSGLVSEPTLWETDLRTSLRLLGEAVSSLPQMMGTEVAESHVIGLGCLLYASGTQLQDARDTIAGAASAPETPSFARPAPGTSTPSGPPSGQLTADNLLQDFQHAIEKHRLTFLYVATPSRLEMHAGIRQLETIDRHMWLDERIPPETIDSEGHFLFKYRGVLERFAQAAIGRFGSGKGMRAREFCDGEFVEVEGGSLPHWSLDETDCSVMESSSELMLDACKMLARADHERRFQKLIQSTRALLHDGGQPRWYASVLVSWDYLSRLDDLIARIKSAEIDLPSADPNDHQPRTTEANLSDDSAAEELLQMPPDQNRAAGLGLLMLLAQAYYKMLEATVSTASWCCALDLELNEFYLWTTKNIRNLLANHEDLKDFPQKFEPIFPDLFPSTIRNTEWDDMVAPEVEGFLSTVHAYLHSRGFVEPSKGSPAWTFIEVFRASASKAIDCAHNYAAKMRQHIRRLMDQPVAGSRPSSPAATSPKPAAETQVNAPMERQPDGVYPTGLIIWNGVSHKCPLSKREMTFMSLALMNDHIPLDQIMNKAGQAIWRERYMQTRKQREKVGKFISRLSTKLLNATPPIATSFSLSRDSHFIRRTPALPQSTDISRTEE